MRIVISGTHGSGKSTLIADFVLAHPEFTVLPDPFELVDETWDAPGAPMFAAQLRASADRLVDGDPEASIIAERGPLDFLAYLIAWGDVAGSSTSREALERSASMTADALHGVDLLVVLPLTADAPVLDDDEHLALRDAMNDALLDLIDDPDLIGEGTRVVEIVGDRDERLSALEASIAAGRPSVTSRDR